MSKTDHVALRDALKRFVKPKKVQARPPKEERIIEEFLQIQRFVTEAGHLPSSDESSDIFERIYATRLAKLRQQSDSIEILKEFDSDGLLEALSAETDVISENISHDDLADKLRSIQSQTGDLRNLKNVKPRAEVRAAEEIATREPCPDFFLFKRVFEELQDDLDRGLRKTLTFKGDTSIFKGNAFIISGQKVYVAEVSEKFYSETRQGDDARLRVIYDNGVQSNLLLSSLQKALYKDGLGRRVSEPDAGPLFSGVPDSSDQASGTIYVLRSKSDIPYVRENRDVLHKIGVTIGSVKKRIANAKNEATYLLADVEIVATCQLYNIERKKLEALIHKVFHNARVEIEIKDRFDKLVKPEEWFLVPLFVIQEVIDRIKDGTITEYKYNVELATLEKR
ncbi:GIY-YIG nuclease family protein [Burkholderiales bacterium]|nr:GIY-YIG nuclease family protein [Burkholderiales bacterium]